MVAKKQTGKTVVKLSNKQLNEMLSQARDLQWAGQHAEAIKVCTQALDAIGKGNSRTVQIQMNLLITQAESYWAKINFGAMKRGAKVMMQIANNAPASSKSKQLALKAQALIWKARVQGVIDNKNELARKTLTNALKAARQIKDKHLEAESLYWLSQTQTGEQKLKNYQQSVELFKSLGDQRGLANAVCRLAWAQARAGATEEARKNAQIALSISEQIGFNLAKSDVFNVLSFMESDIGQALSLLKRSYLTAEASGDLATSLRYTRSGWFSTCISSPCSIWPAATWPGVCAAASVSRSWCASSAAWPRHWVLRIAAALSTAT
jgi:tetratricopeptide (TPR) repeat protein